MQQHIVEGRVEWMALSNALKGLAILVVEDDVTIACWLVTIPWKNDSDLI